MDIKNLDVHYVIADGSAGDIILHTAETEKAGLIITGTHGTRNASEALLGTHTWQVMKKTRVPVLAIPPGFCYSPVKKIVFALQGDEHELLALEHFRKMFLTAGMQLHLLHVTDRPGNPVQEEQRFRQFCERAQEKSGGKKWLVDFRYNDQLAEGLNTYCQEINAGWLVMSPERLTAIERFLYSFSSETRKMSLRTKYPLLLINTACL